MAHPLVCALVFVLRSVAVQPDDFRPSQRLVYDKICIAGTSVLGNVYVFIRNYLLNNPTCARNFPPFNSTANTINARENQLFGQQSVKVRPDVATAINARHLDNTN